MRYPYILMDADDTLFDFGRAEHSALSQTLARHGAPTDEQALARYRQINNGYWDLLDQGQGDKARMLVQRFEDFFRHYALQADCARVNADYLAALGTFAYLIPGALALCRRLHEKGHRLYIVTNGTAAAQGSRFRDSGLEPFFSGVFISEVLGVPKPQRGFFDHVFAAIGNPPKSQCIILGDSLRSDMGGGRNAGIATCWFNPGGAPGNADCDYTIAELSELEAIVD